MIEVRDITDLVRAHGQIVPERVSVIAELHVDDDLQPDEYDCYGAGDFAAFSRGDWQYVGVTVRVCTQDWETQLGSAVLWGVEHGQLNGVTADALSYTPSVTSGASVMMGSALYEVTDTALTLARETCAAAAAIDWSM